MTAAQNFSNPKYEMPYLLSGEIIEANEDALLDGEGEARAVGYTVLVEFPNGSRTVYRNVAQACMFGGIGDFFQSRLRASHDNSGQFTLPKDVEDSSRTMSTLGARVLIQFIAGDMRRPIIVGHLPHPKRVYDIPDEQDFDTQSKMSHKGFEVATNVLGEVKFTHRGAPVEKDIVTGEQMDMYEREEKGPPEFDPREDVSPLPSEPFEPALPNKLMTEASLANPTENAALGYPDKKFTSEMGFLCLGEWYVVDSEGQQIMLDRDAKAITITNGSDTIQLDKEHKKIFLRSSGDFEIASDNDYVASVFGNKHQTVDLNELRLTRGNHYQSVGGTRTANIVDSDTIKAGSSFDVQVGVADAVEGGSGTSAEQHRASISLSTGNTFMMDDESVMMIHNTGALFTVDKTGNITILAKDGSNVYLNAEEGTVTVMSSKGALLSLDDKITAIDQTGKQMISIKDGTIDITAGDQVTITGSAVSINAGNVTLGAQAQMSAVLGENLQAWLDAHTHMCPSGPTTPPVIPSASLTGSPASIVSKAVKVRQ